MRIAVTRSGATSEATYLGLSLPAGTVISSPMSGRVSFAPLPTFDSAYAYAFLGTTLRIYDPRSCSAYFSGQTQGWGFWGDVVLEPKLNNVTPGTVLGRMGTAGMIEPGGYNLMLAASGPEADAAMLRLFPAAYTSAPVELRYETTSPRRSFLGGNTFCDGP